MGQRAVESNGARNSDVLAGWGLNLRGFMMLVYDYMTPDPFVVSRTEPIAGILATLRTHGIHQMPVVDESNRLVGIVTDRDVRSAIGLRPAGEICLSAGDIMTSKVITITPGTDLEEALDILSEARFGSLPVVVGEHVVGILSTRDLLRRFRALLKEQTKRGSVEAIEASGRGVPRGARA
ncbi:MAG: HPP family protein [Phycisphaerae bacterium]